MREPIAAQFSGHARRCNSQDENAGRCQLLATHHPYFGPHAVRSRETYVTWTDKGQRLHWPARAPQWLRMLPWAPGYHSAHYDEQADEHAEAS